MGRFSPTVLPDTEPRSRPGLEISEAFAEFRQAQGEEEERGFVREDRAEAAVDRTRRRSREDIGDAATQLEFEQYVRDQIGGTPQQAQEPIPPTRGAFDEARLGLAAQGPQGPLTEEVDLGPEEVVVLPGQFAGGTFSPQAVRVGGTQTRTLAGREFAVDPSQTAEARHGRAVEGERTRIAAEEEDELQRKIRAMVQAGIDPREAEARALGVDVGTREEPVGGFDPDDPSQFTDRADYLAFQRQLANAKDAVGRRPPGAGGGPAEKPEIALKDAFLEVDRLLGVWNPDTETYETDLSEGERLDFARRMTRGELTSEEVEDIAARRREEAPLQEEPQFEHGPFKRFFERNIRGGRTGLERKSTPQAMEAAPDDTPRAHDVPPTGVGTGSPVSDSILAIAEEFSDLDQGTIREILLEQYTEAEVNKALRRR